jgi:4-oxalocrotonate tautomerase
MPFVRIWVDETRSTTECAAISEGVYEALREAVNAPLDDKFHVITRHSAQELVYSADYLGVERSAHFIAIHIHLYPGRTVEQKKLIFQTIAEKLATNPGVRKEDIFTMLVDTPRENWSYGNGEAQFAPSA